MTASPVVAAHDVAAVQRRTLRVLFGTQIVGGVGIAIGVTVGALLAAELGGVRVSGVVSSCAVVGAALFAIPVTRVMQRSGRRPGLVMAYAIGGAGAVLIVTAAVLRSLPLLITGMVLFGGGSAANLQARYTAADLAPADRRGRQLSMVVWGTTLGAVSAPNLASFADRALAGLQLPRYAGPFVVSTGMFLAAALILAVLLRPDPLLLARRVAAAAGAGADPSVEPAASLGPVTRPLGARSVLRWAADFIDALRFVLEVPAARLALVAVTVGHLVMIAVMSMTPVYIGAGRADHGEVLRIVGFVLSAHIAGMYALSPVVGWLTDRVGRRAVILLGVGLLLAACAVAGTADHHTPQLTAGMMLLGLGWSCTMVSGSTLLAESVPVDRRPVVQGLSDLTMGMFGAAAGALSGVVVEMYGYPVLSLLAAATTVPVVLLAVQPVPTREVPDNG